MAVHVEEAVHIPKMNSHDPDSLNKHRWKHPFKLYITSTCNYLKVFISLDQHYSMVVLLVAWWVILYSGGSIILAEASLPTPLVVVRGPGKVSPTDEDLCKKLGISCVHGVCVNDSEPHCKCNQGWKGTACDTCGGRMMYVLM